jgi:hypothetical protein
MFPLSRDVDGKVFGFLQVQFIGQPLSFDLRPAEYSRRLALALAVEKKKADDQARELNEKR